MNEWKELNIANLPPDILIGDYVFETKTSGTEWTTSINNGDVITVLGVFLKYNNEGQRYRYRKPEQKPPSHEEIMTKWWETTYADGYIWVKITHYNPDRETCYGWVEDDHIVWDSAEGFLDYKSSNIPPEK